MAVIGLTPQDTLSGSVNNPAYAISKTDFIAPMTVTGGTTGGLFVTNASVAAKFYETIDAVAVGQVMCSAGVATLPAWSASPTVTGTFTALHLTATGTVTAAQLAATATLAVAGVGPHAIGGSTDTSWQLIQRGAFSPSGAGGGYLLNSSLTGAAGLSIYGHFLQPTFIEAASGVHGLIASSYIAVATVTPGAATVTNTASFYIAGPMTAAVSGLNYAMWSVSGVNRFGGQIWAADGAAAAPALAREDGTTGLSLGANRIGLGLAGTEHVALNATGAAYEWNLDPAVELTWGAYPGDLRLSRSAAGILQQKNAANAQTFRVFGDATKYLELLHNATSGVVSASSGSLQVGAVGASSLTFFTTNATRWEVTAAGHFLAAAGSDNLYDIGALGATRPRTGHFGTSIVSPAATITTVTSVTVTASGTIQGATINGTTQVLSPIVVAGSGIVTPPATGAFRMGNNLHLMSTNAGGTDKSLITINTSDRVVISGDGLDIQWGRAVVAMGGGAAPTFGTIGGAGPIGAAQTDWLKVYTSTGAIRFMPLFT